MHVELQSTKGCVFEKPFDSYDRKYCQLATVTTCTVCSAKIRYSAETCRSQAKKQKTKNNKKNKNKTFLGTYILR